MRHRFVLALCLLLFAVCPPLAPSSSAGEWREVARREGLVYLLELPAARSEDGVVSARVRIRAEGLGFEEELIYQFSEDGKLYRNLDSVVRASDGGVVET